MSKHIGIVACSAPGAALCYTTICVEAPEIMGANHNPEISLHMMDFCEHVRCMERDDWDGVANLMLRYPSTKSRRRVRISPSVPIIPVTLRCQRSNAIHRSRGCILWMLWLMRRSVKAAAD